MEKRLYKSKNNKVLGGVCGGLADYFDVDPVLVRVIAIVLIFTATSVIAYIILWVIMPHRPENSLPPA